METKVRIMQLSTELLRQVLQLPDGTDIVDVRMSFDRPGVMELRILHDSFSPMRDGYVIPRVTPVFGDDGFVSWGERV